MSRFVVDASVAIKWFVPEIHTPAARHLLNQGRQLIAPDFIWAEMGNAVWKKKRRKEISHEEARDMVLLIKDLRIETFSTKEIMEPAWELAERLDTAVYDCLYLALALMKDAVFVTADRKFYNNLIGKMVPGNIVWIEDITKHKFN